MVKNNVLTSYEIFSSWLWSDLSSDNEHCFWVSEELFIPLFEAYVNYNATGLPIHRQVLHEKITLIKEKLSDARKLSKF